MIVLGLFGPLLTEVDGATLIKRMEGSSVKELVNLKYLRLSERFPKDDLQYGGIMKADGVENYRRAKTVEEDFVAVRNSNADSNLPHVKEFKTTVKGTKMECKLVKWDQGYGKGQSFWEFYEKIGDSREKVRSAQSLVRVEIEGEDPYYPIMIRYQVPQNQWVIGAPEILHDQNKDSWNSIQQFFDNGSPRDEHQMEVLFQGGLEGIDPGATSSTSKFFVARYTAPRGYELNLPHGEHETIIKVPVADLSEVIKYLEKNEYVVHVGLSHLVAGISWNSIRSESESKTPISTSLMRTLESLRSLKPSTSFQDFNQDKTGVSSKVDNIYPTENLPHITKIKTMNRSKFLPTLEAEWKSGDNLGHELFVQRTRRDDIGIDSVSGLVEVESKGQKPYVPLLIQYRVPLNKWILEAPAGLRDAGETPIHAFQREFLEEVGDQMGGKGSKPQEYGTKILHESGTQAKDPSSSRATAKFFIGKVKASDEYKTVETKHEASENIKVLKVPTDLLGSVIDYWKVKDQVTESGLSQFRIGMYLNSKDQEQESTSIERLVERLKKNHPELLNQLEDILSEITPETAKSRL